MNVQESYGYYCIRCGTEVPRGKDYMVTLEHYNKYGVRVKQARLLCEDCAKVFARDFTWWMNGR